jgi:[acyl-carrier-protein] S-malonyltransferase
MTKNAFIFPGQGSQTIGMLADIAQNHPKILDTFNEVSDKMGYDLWELIQEDPESKLNLTEYTQVAMLTSDVAIFRLLQKAGKTEAAFMAGHSLGEYAALVCSSAISLVDAAKLVAKRGQLMQESVPAGQGAMAAIVGLTDAQVEDLCKEASSSNEQVTPANFNAIGQVVVAGHTPAVHRVVAAAEKASARLAAIIPVSVPCHCGLLTKAAESFSEFLSKVDFKVPKIPVISNVDLSTYQSPEQIRALLSKQLYMPVRWVETIQLLKRNQVEKIIECGPGKVLSGLVKRIDNSLTTVSICNEASLRGYLE